MAYNRMTPSMDGSTPRVRQHRKDALRIAADRSNDKFKAKPERVFGKKSKILDSTRARDEAEAGRLSENMRVAVNNAEIRLKKRSQITEAI